MGALPKHRISSYRQGKRRAGHSATAKQVQLCVNCQKPVISHRACSSCGNYKQKTA